jgi:hypothetical protein
VEKNSLLSNEAIVTQEMGTVCEFEKNLRISNIKEPQPQPF